MKQGSESVEVAGAAEGLPVDLHSRLGDLADGELDRAASEAMIDRLLESTELRAAWADIHWVGDCVRSDDLAVATGGAAFLASFAARLAAEPTVLAPARRVPWQRLPWVRYGLPTASAAAAVVMVVTMVGPGTMPGGAGSVAVAPPAPVAVGPVAMVAPEHPKLAPALERHLAAYVAAHQEYTVSTIHGPGYIRAASLTGLAQEPRE